MKVLRDYFLRGLLIFVPGALTIFAVIWAFTTLDGLFRGILGVKIPGLGVVITIALITGIGLLASNLVGKKIFDWFESILAKLPLMKLLYSASKDMIEAFAGEKKSFDKPVLVELVVGGPMAMGFMTKKSLGFLGLTDHVAVYLPQSYNFAGSVLIFPTKQVRPLDIGSSDAMAFIVSGGVSGK
ncbi:MAG: DUF502 domain-containing protein [Deltaproteobacteria bacterium]|jgi:uncharacterized membrane protein|nr:DUF502 domain-containing protein [Deltaproteobacteria bacterium]